MCCNKVFHFLEALAYDIVMNLSNFLFVDCPLLTSFVLINMYLCKKQ